MEEIVDILEQRVAAAVALIASLRDRVAALEAEVTRAGQAAATRAAERPGPVADPALAEELERLRAERAAVRDRVRSLIREIDRVAW